MFTVLNLCFAAGRSMCFAAEILAHSVCVDGDIAAQIMEVYQMLDAMIEIEGDVRYFLCGMIQHWISCMFYELY